MMNEMARSKVTDEENRDAIILSHIQFYLVRESDQHASSPTFSRQRRNPSYVQHGAHTGIKAMHVCTFIIRLSTSPNTTVAHSQQSEPHSTTAAQTAIP